MRPLSALLRALRYSPLAATFTLAICSNAPQTFAQAPLPPVENEVAVDNSVEGFTDESIEARFQRLELMLQEQRQQNEELREQLQNTLNSGPAEAPSTEPAEPQDEAYTIGSDLDFKAFWKNGLEFQNKNKDFRVHITGRVQVDTVFMGGDPVAYVNAGGIGDEDSVNFRRGRIGVEGTIYETIEFNSQWDFVNQVNADPGQPITEARAINIPVPTDQWVTFKELPYVGNFRAGIMKDPIGMEHLTSSRFLDFMERSYNQDAFYGPNNNGFIPGLMIFDTYADENATWAAGVFKSNARSNPMAYSIGDGEYEAAGRLTWLPYYDEPTKGRYLFHTGISGLIRDTNRDTTADDLARVRTRGSLRNGPPGPLNPVFADSGTFTADDEQMINLEAAFQNGPLLIQSEYTIAQFTDAVGGFGVPPGTFIGDYNTQGFYVQVLYFLTGENRDYDRKAGVFGRVVPHENFFLVRNVGLCGIGAWQVGARYSHLDLIDAGIDGGSLDDVTLGLNWFLNPNMKVQWNVIYTQRDIQNSALEGDFYGAGARFAWDF